MDHSYRDETGASNTDTDLHSLLSQDPIRSWEPILKRIKDHPSEAQERYYRNESCLQLALRATEQSDHMKNYVLDDKSGQKRSHINRIDVLRAILDSDKDAIRWRDDEGRTPLHTACSAGRSFEVLQWLLDEEKQRLKRVQGLDLSTTIRTDFPGGSLPLHTIAACSTFDEEYFRTSDHTDETMYLRCMEHFQSCPVQVKIAPDVLAAYAATTTIIEANPKAIMDKDCEGELPLHSAASFGSIGSVLAILNASCDIPPSVGAQTLNDRQKTPLSCACERVAAFSVHKKETAAKSISASTRRSEINSLRVSIDRDDPFEGWDMNTDRPRGIRGRRNGNGNLSSSMNAHTGTSLRGSRQGHGSRARSSLSTSFVLSGGRFGLGNEQSNNDLRFSFTSTRTPIHPEFGLADLDEDGEEEFSKVELITMAACGVFDDNGMKRGDAFHLVHELIRLGQPPELIWHAARRNPGDVTTKDDSRCVPLHLACERLAQALAPKYCEDESKQSSECISDVDSSSSAGRVFVESFFLGDSNILPELSLPSEVNGDGDGEQLDERDAPLRTRTLSVAPTHQVSHSIEIFNMLLYSREFGSREMASVKNHQGRLPLHMILDTMSWTDASDDERSHPISSLVDAYPQALESKDGLTGLYPFMLAATLATEDNDLSAVETTYRLLLTSPAVIALFD
jgi:ankyrin repeat protein